MDCPNCIERLALTDAHGIQTFTCKYCSGVWIPERSLSTLLKVEGVNTSPQTLLMMAGTSFAGKRKCPTCPNQTLSILTTHDVEIDACPKCYGLFLDKGEISKILPNTHKSQSYGGTLAAGATTEGIIWVIIAFLTGIG